MTNLDKKGLTEKQNAFAQALLTEKSKSDAYRLVYDCTNMKAKTINDAASKLSNHYGVAQRVSELKEGQIEQSFTDTNGLTVKQEKFAQLVVKYGSYSRAYRESYDCKNSSPATVNRDAHELRHNPKIAPRIEEIKRWLFSESNIFMSRVMAEVEAIAFSNITDFIDEKGDIKPISEFDKHKAKAIASVKTTTSTLPDGGVTRTTEIKLNVSGKNANLIMLRQILPPTNNPNEAITVTHEETKKLKLKIRANNESEEKVQREKAAKVMKYKNDYDNNR